MNRAVFLDKDGTLVNDVPYNVDPAQIELASTAHAALASLHAAGFALVVVSNQSGVARGYFGESALLAVERRLRELLAEVGVPLAGFYYCPHHPAGTVARYATTCNCRKPHPGMLVAAADELNVDLSRSWLIGDILDDIEAGRRAGCRTVLLDNGHETQWKMSPIRQPHFRVPNLAEAGRQIVAAETSPVLAEMTP